MTLNKYRLGVMGGSYSPVHNGHVFLAEFVKENCRLDKLLIIPTGKHPFQYKQKRKMPEPEHRLKMLELAFENDEGIEVSDIEMRSSEVSYTYNTLCRLREIYGAEYKISFVFGTDELLSFHKWYEAENLMREFSFIVGIRPGYRLEEVESIIEDYRTRWNADIEVINLPAPDVSSTEVREAIATDADFSGMVPEKVWKYIKENGLYQNIKQDSAEEGDIDGNC